MAQYDVFVNPNATSRTRVPYVLDVQSGLLDGLPSRLVLPLSRTGIEARGVPVRLVPEFEVEGQRVHLHPQFAAAVDAKQLRRPVASLANRIGDIRDALDAVVSGI